MPKTIAGNYNVFSQYLISILLIVMISLFCFFSKQYIGYQVVALILLMVVSVLAMLFDILPVLITAILSALVWNYFFIPPIGTFHIGKPEDVLIFLMYFVIAMINTVLTFKIRQFEKKARDKEEKENTIRLYDTLLNSLSHELRTPISAIIGSVDTLEENNKRLSEENRKLLISEIKIAGLRLNRQVENLLSISRLEAGILKPKMDWCDLNELIYSVIKKCKDDELRHKISFQSDENLPMLRLDRVFMEQIIQNLIINALVHTRDDSEIIIVAVFSEEKLVVTISDNGEGFPSGDIQRVFDKFYRLQRSAPGGTGLGLSIVKGFTEALNGKIHLQNQATGGAKFTIEIPTESSPLIEAEHE